jgi:phosphatidylglycerophosphate synthase
MDGKNAHHLLAFHCHILPNEEENSPPRPTPSLRKMSVDANGRLDLFGASVQLSAVAGSGPIRCLGGKDGQAKLSLVMTKTGAPTGSRFGQAMNNQDNITRRPLKSRDTKWAAAIARWLARAGIRPNVISVAGAVFSAGAGICFWFAGRTAHDWRWSALLILAACAMQLRLLCNLFDGMVAIEGGFRTKAGEIFNELPDRFSDAFIFIGAGYSLPEFRWTLELGWTAAALSLITAYARALGASMGAGQLFLGPMAKQQRMAAMTAACGVGMLAPLWPMLSSIIPLTLGLVAAGCVVTIVRRSRRIAQEMESRK